jgi:hypothetical protein
MAHYRTSAPEASTQMWFRLQERRGGSLPYFAGALTADGSAKSGSDFCTDFVTPQARGIATASQMHRVFMMSGFHVMLRIDWPDEEIGHKADAEEHTHEIKGSVVRFSLRYSGRDPAVE